MDLILTQLRIQNETFLGAVAEMPINQRICSKCGKPVKLMLPPGGKGPRTFQCIRCDRPDPIKSLEVEGLINGLLHDPKE
jgi:hypothetical protein